jgi:hypothetical protein
VGTPMAGNEDTGGSPEEPADPLVMNKALAASLAAALDIRDQEQAEDLADAVAQVRAAYIASTADAPRRVPAYVVRRRLESIARALRGPRPRPPTRRALASPGVAAALRRAGFDVVERTVKKPAIKERALREGIGSQTLLKGARAKSREAIENENFAKALTYVAEAIRRVRSLETKQRGKRDVHLGRHADDAKTTAVIALAKLYQLYTGAHPTRRGAGPLTRFEQLLDAALGDLTRNNGRALARRWRRHAAAQGGGQNGVPCSSRAMPEG